MKKVIIKIKKSLFACLPKRSAGMALALVIGITQLPPFGGTEGGCQDIHFSQYYASPIMTNPSATGQFNGDYRLGLIYRNQWSSFIKPYVTYSGFFDKVVHKEIIGDDFLGVGLVLYSDKAGTAQLMTQSARASFAYHKRLGLDKQHLVSIGFTGGITQKGVDYDDLKYGNQYESAFYNSELDNGESFPSNSFINPELNAGGSWNYKFSENLEFTVGVSLFNLTKPNESFYDADDNRLNNRFSFIGSAAYKLNDKTTILPGFIYGGQTKASEFIIGSNASYLVKDLPLSKASVFFGAWYRAKDAIILVPGFEYNNYKFGFSYDINVSSLKEVSKGKGAFEFSLIYIFNANPKLGIKRSIPCKRL